MKLFPSLAAAALLAALPLAGPAPRPQPPSRYLVVWAMQARNPTAKFTLRPDGTAPLGLGRDFLAVYNISPDATPFGKLEAMLPTGPASFVHHTNYAMPPDRILYANDWLGGRTYVFDLRQLLHPRLLRKFQNKGAYGWPHSFAYLPNRDTLVTFQFSGGFDHAPGGLVELAPDGHLVRSSSAAVAAFPHIRPYSLAVVPSLDRVVTGSSPMAAGSTPSHVVQIWRLSDLKLLSTLVLLGDAQTSPKDAFEPRLLADGSTVVVPSADCHLFLVHGLAGNHPSLQHIFNFNQKSCGVPALSGNYYLQPSTAGESVTSLDLRHPARPRLVNRLQLPPGDKPHWVSADPNPDPNAHAVQVAITGFGAMITQVLFATLDPNSGQLRLSPHALDLSAHAHPSAGPNAWPDGWTGAAIPHAAIFTHP